MKRMQREFSRIFIFGEIEYVVRKVMMKLCDLAGKRVKIEMEIVQAKIPWLIGNETMEKYGMVINIMEIVI